ncbi:hypothetical protein [Streptomyces sp. BBFR102]|uniref:hypothetical protein n=1 Tax=Streptomyces sp. BBFR102 TaxID=3448171 RepID=UPI003F535DAD
MSGWPRELPHPDRPRPERRRLLPLQALDVRPRSRSLDTGWQSQGRCSSLGGIGSLFEDDTTADTAKLAVAETTPEPSKEPAADAETDEPAKPSAISSPNAAQTADLIAGLPRR